MQMLKEKVFEIYDELNQAWIEEVKAAKGEDRDVSSVNVFSKDSDLNKRLNMVFLDFEQRHSPKKKNGWFGGK